MNLKYTSTTKRTKLQNFQSLNAVMPDDPMWDVEEIVDKRYFQDKKQYKYLVKWRDWSSVHNTWEPIEHLDNAMDLVVKYEEKLQSSKNSKKLTKMNLKLAQQEQDIKQSQEIKQSQRKPHNTTSNTNQRNNEELYFVEKVLNKKWFEYEKAFKYEVKWRNYELSQNTWEPVENLLAVADLVEEFEQQSITLKKEQKMRQSSDNIQKVKEQNIFDDQYSDVQIIDKKSKKQQKNVPFNKESIDGQNSFILKKEQAQNSFSLKKEQQITQTAIKIQQVQEQNIFDDEYDEVQIIEKKQIKNIPFKKESVDVGAQNSDTNYISKQTSDIVFWSNEIKEKKKKEKKIKKKSQNVKKENDNLSFIIEKIINKQFYQEENRYKYLVKWENYSHDYNTWEPIENLHSVKHLVEDYERDNNQISQKSDVQTQDSTIQINIKNKMTKYCYKTKHQKDIFYVEKILNKRYFEDLKIDKYEVKWKNYSNKYNTWEPLDNLLAAIDLIEEFEKKEEKNSTLVVSDPIEKLIQQDKDVYLVEKILNKKYFPQEKKNKYLIKWQNYDHSHNSWEPTENLQMIDDLIQQFDCNYQEPVSSQNEGVYQIEQILDKRYFQEQNCFKYKIKWIQQDQSHPLRRDQTYNSWEPIENLFSVLPQIQEFEKELEDKKEQKNKKSIKTDKKQEPILFSVLPQIQVHEKEQKDKKQQNKKSVKTDKKQTLKQKQKQKIEKLVDKQLQVIEKLAEIQQVEIPDKYDKELSFDVEEIPEEKKNIFNNYLDPFKQVINKLDNIQSNVNENPRKNSNHYNPISQPVTEIINYNSLSIGDFDIDEFHHQQSSKIVERKIQQNFRITRQAREEFIKTLKSFISQNHVFKSLNPKNYHQQIENLEKPLFNLYRKDNETYNQKMQIYIELFNLLNQLPELSKKIIQKNFNVDYLNKLFSMTNNKQKLMQLDQNLTIKSQSSQSDTRLTQVEDPLIPSLDQVRKKLQLLEIMHQQTYSDESSIPSPKNNKKNSILQKYSNKINSYIINQNQDQSSCSLEIQY